MARVTSADGTVIGYETDGDGPPMLLVHGSTGSRHRWSPVRASLRQRYTLHMMDRRRGRGLSTAEAGPYSLRREAEDVAAIAKLSAATCTSSGIPTERWRSSRLH
jgi:pimeloyl-ACP methyl ester carboxylesterase